MDLDSYTAGAERFLIEMNLEYHLHFSGRKPDYRIEEIYERHADLFDRPAVDGLREAREASSGEARRHAGQLLELAVGAHLGRACAAEEAELAAREATIEIELDGGRIPYRMAPLEMANEPDRERRGRIEAARREVLAERLTPLHRATLERSHELIAELGWASYATAAADLGGIDLARLSAGAAAFLEATDPVYEALLDPELEAVLGLGLGEVRRADLGRFFRAPALDATFPSDRLVQSFAATMSGLGLGLGAQSGITFDTEQRASKAPRAYCAPVRVPEEVFLVVPRFGGREDYAALFHEGGHAMHYANMDPALPLGNRRLGDNSVTESFAFLFERITEEEGWVEQALGAEPGPVLSNALAVRIYFLRRFAAKIAYELELHGAGVDLAAMPARYAALLSSATGVDWDEESWLDDVDPGFYVAFYLRAWALEARWRAHLSGTFGKNWFEEPDAGEWLRKVWWGGQRLRADELLLEALGEELRFEDLAAEFA